MVGVFLHTHNGPGRIYVVSRSTGQTWPRRTVQRSVTRPAHAHAPRFSNPDALRMNNAPSRLSFRLHDPTSPMDLGSFAFRWHGHCARGGPSSGYESWSGAPVSSCSMLRRVLQRMLRVSAFLAPGLFLTLSLFFPGPPTALCCMK